MSFPPLRARRRSRRSPSPASTYRFFNKDAAFVANELDLFKDADNVALAGASLAGVSEKFVKSREAFWEQLQIAKDLHSIQTVVLIDHMECGAYKAEFEKPGEDWTPETERKKHFEVMNELALRLREKNSTSSKAT